MNWIIDSWEYLAHLLILIGMYSILAQSFNLIFGLGGLFNLAHVASYAIGAYATALGSVELQLDFFQCLISSALLCALFSLFVGAISLRLSHDYFAIGTLAFSSLVSALLINWKSLTRGVLGIPGIPRPEFASIDFLNNTNFLLLLLVLVVIIQVILWLAFRNSFGRALKAQSEYEQAALALGYHTRLTRNTAFIIASACAGMAGSMFAYYINYIDPSSFSFSETVFILSIVVVGRPGSFWGVLAATFFLVLLPEGIRFVQFINERPHILGPMRQLLHSLILFSVVWINRARLFPLQRKV